MAGTGWTSMGAPSKTDTRMTAEAFMTWYDMQPDGPRYELLDGAVHKAEAERLIHARTKARVHDQFIRQIEARHLPCEALPDGMAIHIDEETVFEPDALVRCGPPLPDDATLIADPLIVVEVASPSTQRIDAVVKFTRYFRNPSIVHYLIVIPTARSVIHHARAVDGRIVSVGYEGGSVRLEPPGLDLDLADLFPVESAA